jgi:uncharacterized membrane protein YqhA
VESVLDFVRVNILGIVDDARAEELEKIMTFLVGVSAVFLLQRFFALDQLLYRLLLQVMQAKQCR